MYSQQVIIYTYIPSCVQETVDIATLLTCPGLECFNLSRLYEKTFYQIITNIY